MALAGAPEKKGAAKAARALVSCVCCQKFRVLGGIDMCHIPPIRQDYGTGAGKGASRKSADVIQDECSLNLPSSNTGSVDGSHFKGGRSICALPSRFGLPAGRQYMLVLRR